MPPWLEALIYSLLARVPKLTCWATRPPYMAKAPLSRVEWDVCGFSSSLSSEKGALRAATQAVLCGVD